MNALDLLILALACLRLAYMLVREDGPAHLFARIRARTTFGGLLECVFCSSVWTAVGVLVVWLTPVRPIVYPLAISGLALMAAKYTGVEYQA